jgi:hypothetical protein
MGLIVGAKTRELIEMGRTSGLLAILRGGYQPRVFQEELTGWS